MNALRLASPLVVLAALVAACGGSAFSVGSDRSASTGEDGGGSADASAGSCSNDAECGEGFACAFPRADACTAKGSCFDIRGLATCAMYSAGCACDGTEINVACLPFPAGYVPKPLAHAGACGSSVDAGVGCNTQSDCASGFQCVFPKADACTAAGVCKDVRGIATCAAYSAGCACDGTDINVACQPFDGFVSKPLLHPGTCADAGLLITPSCG